MDAQINLICETQCPIMLFDILAKKAMAFARIENLEITDYMIGLKYSYAIVQGPEGRAMGVAYMPAEDMTKGAATIPTLENLGKIIGSTNMQSKSLGIATINAISQYALWFTEHNEKITYRNIVDYIPRCCPQGKVVVIGNMVPLVKKLKESRDVVVLERSAHLRYNSLPDSLLTRVVNDAELLIITGATLINDSLDFILSIARGRKFMVGPTAGVFPPWLSEKVDIIAGAKIENIGETIDIIKRGGGRWDFAAHCREYVIT